MTRELYWCPSCGVVWADADGPPICRHWVPDSPTPVRRMEPLPPWHPFAAAAGKEHQ